MVSVAAVITDDHGRALLIQRRDNHHWEPPGGVLELGETIQRRAPPRSLRGNRPRHRAVALTGVYKNMTRGIIALVFRCKATGGELASSDEVTACRWADETEVDELAEQAYAVRVLDGMHDDRPAAVRAHDGVRLLAADHIRG